MLLIALAFFAIKAAGYKIFDNTDLDDAELIQKTIYLLLFVIGMLFGAILSRLSAYASRNRSFRRVGPSVAYH